MQALSETMIARVALGVIALHVVDDSSCSPSPGRRRSDDLVGGLVLLAVLGLAAWGYPRLRAGLRATIALILGGFPASSSASRAPTRTVKEDRPATTSPASSRFQPGWCLSGWRP